MIYLIRRRKLGRGSCRGIKQFSQQGIRSFRNDRRLPEAELVFRWGCTSNLPGQPRIVNEAEAIHLTVDKIAFRKKLQAEQLCPITWFPESIELPHYPVIVRPRNHAQGRRLHMCRTREEFYAAKARYPGGWYASEFINKVAEYRVFVCQGRAVWVANKIPGNPADIAWNVARGGKFENVGWTEWPLRVVKTAIAAWKLSGLDFGGVDVMVDGEGKPYVLEINAAPSQTSPYRQQCVAKAFDWIVQRGKAEIPLQEEKGGYRKFIHPAVCAEAKL